MRGSRAGLFFVVLLLAGCGAEEEHGGITLKQAQKITACPGSSYKSVACTPTRGGWRCQSGGGNSIVSITGGDDNDALVTATGC